MLSAEQRANSSSKDYQGKEIKISSASNE